MRGPLSRGDPVDPALRAHRAAPRPVRAHAGGAPRVAGESTFLARDPGSAEPSGDVAEGAGGNDDTPIPGGRVVPGPTPSVEDVGVPAAASSELGGRM